ncbi:hypothetical protein BJV77DRAFT_964533 [Russula vinacea]|nr:hypothetical protein BJV77DRAFT_964533 [Russula vinacea]
MFLLRIAAPLASLVFFSAFAVAQVSAANCTLARWDWTFNSLGQTPCTVAAYMMATCNGGLHVPHAKERDGLRTVTLSSYLPAAYVSVISWFDYVTNCNETMPPSSFPHPVPLEIRVPRWALLDVRKEIWSSHESYAVGDSPELGPGSILDASGVTITPTSSLTLGASSLTVTPTSSLIFSASSVTITSTSSSILGPSGVSVTHASPFPSASSIGSPTPPPSRDSSSNTPAIAGGIAGGMVAISIAGVAIIYLRRRSKVLRQVLSAVYEGVGASQPRTTGLYDLDDPNSFPEYQGDTQSQDILIPSQVTTPSNTGTSGSRIASSVSLFVAPVVSDSLLLYVG